MYHRNRAYHRYLAYNTEQGDNIHVPIFKMNVNLLKYYLVYTQNPDTNWVHVAILMCQ